MNLVKYDNFIRNCIVKIFEFNFNTNKKIKIYKNFRDIRICT